MVHKKALLILVLLISIAPSLSCAYVVLPEGLDESAGGNKAENFGWAGIVTNVGESESGGVHIDITIRNDTGDWSAMRAVDNKPAVLTSSAGKSTDCDTVFIGTGGHRLAPGFQTRGYTSAENDQPETQLLYVECEGAVEASEIGRAHV